MSKWRAIFLGIGVVAATTDASNGPAPDANALSQLAQKPVIQKPIAQNVDANRVRLARIRLMLEEFEALAPTSTYVLRDKTPKEVQWETSGPRQTVKVSYTCDQLKLHKAKLEYGLKWPGTPAQTNNYCETWYVSYVGRYRGVMKPPEDGWMLGTEGDFGNGCVKSLVVKCTVTERQFVHNLLREYLETMTAVIQDQLALDQFVVGTNRAANSQPPGTPSAVVSNRSRLEKARELLGASSDLSDHAHFSRLISEQVELLTAVVDDQAILERALTTNK